MKKIAVIAGAGPAGLTAALELLRRSDITPIVIEADTQVGGLSKTVNYRGNRMDLGGHRFFSKSDWVMRWWQEILPVAEGHTQPPGALRIHYQGQSRDLAPEGLGSASSDAVMLVRRRLSRIFYRRRYFDYPLTLNASTVKNLGLVEAFKIGLSYGRAQLKSRSPEITLEDFLINRFGNRLYRTFFKDYTEKVWGVPCAEISAQWGAQRIKGLSVTKAIAHALARPFRDSSDTAQRGTETSLIERFLYPKFGPGQMWEEVARRVTTLGGAIHLRQRVVAMERAADEIVSVDVFDETTRALRRVPCDHFLSTMPVKDLIAILKPDETHIAQIAADLPYRSLMTAGLLLRSMRGRPTPSDNWIYIQEPDVRIGRLQIFNNWSPALLADPGTVWLGLEYFCDEGDDLWAMEDERFLDFAIGELETIGLIERKEVIDGTLVRVPRAYPAYFGTYNQFADLRKYLDRFSNLYPIGRNGMHRYNNQDHSMLTANAAVDSITEKALKEEIWNINAEESYHEEAIVAEDKGTHPGRSRPPL
ncbi:MAG TPA: NAD(P)/FAD-dependent oxidoreductase [Steroidobacteraceae bacterium]|jgi:protoporphyrinogen oxidase|nr:NAD(P)/FAD-dependent oxidoreductase [Steroidobacteraceae bacterium]